MPTVVAKVQGWLHSRRGSASSIKTIQQPKPKAKGRLDAIEILQAAKTPCCVWLQEVISAHEGSIYPHELVLLVDQPRKAAEILYQAGYALTGPPSRFRNDQKLRDRGLKLTLPGTDVIVVLYFAKDWCFDLGHQVSGVPPLSAFMDSMMEVWLNLSPQDYAERLQLALYLAGLIEHCYRLNDPLHGQVKSIEYASNLREEHRQLHFDIVTADSKTNFASAPAHAYHARRYHEIKNGEWVPMPMIRRPYRVQLTTIEEGV